MKKQSGFTLIELVMVIVILGVLAVTAIPKFIDLKTDAQAAAAEGVAGALTSASAINYAARSANSAKGAAVAKCSDVATLLQGAALPSTNYTFAGTDGDLAVTAGGTSTCVLTYKSGSGTATATTNFTAFGIS